MIDLRQTLEYVKYMSSLGWVGEKVGNNYCYIKNFPIIGSFIKFQRPDKLGDKEIEEIKRLGKKYRAFQIVVEPKYTEHYTLLTEHGFRQSRNPYLPSKTIHIDLTKSENQLLKEMHYKTRYNIKKSHNSQLTTHNSKDILSFADFWQECAIKQRFMYLSQKKEITELYKALKKNADLIFTLHSNELVAGILLLHADKTSYYMYAASNQEGKRLFAPTICAWEAIKMSKKRGLKIFDFEGIYDERFPLKNWEGFTRFKKSFGGSEIEYPGAFSKFRVPL